MFIVVYGFIFFAGVFEYNIKWNKRFEILIVLIATPVIFLWLWYTSILVLIVFWCVEGLLGNGVGKQFHV